MTYKNKQIIETVLNIESNNLNKNLDSLILHTLKDKYENKCTEHGFIINNTIELINRKLGKINTINNISCISYIVKYSCDIIYPSEGDQIQIIVDKVNKMGVIGYIDNPNKNAENSPLIVIIPNEYFNESTRDIDSITKNQKINIITLSVRIKYGNTKIQIVGKPV